MGIPSGLEYLIDYLPFYIEDCLARGQSDKTTYTKENLLNMFLNWGATQHVTKVTDLSIDVLEEYRRHLYRHRKSDGQPLQLSTQRMRLMAITGFLKFLDYYDVLATDFYKKFTLPRVPRRLPKQIPEFEEIELILRQTEVAGALRLRDRTILELLYASGIRRCEAVKLDTLDIDFNHSTLTIRKGKGSLDRVVPIAERTQKWLKRYLKELRPKLSSISSGEALFLDIHGGRLKDSALTELVGNYVLRSGVVKQGACHLFRHTSATHMMRNGADIRYIQEFLGHQDINSTMIYTHVTINDLSEAYSECHPAAK